MMKNISILLAGFFSLLFLVSCEKDEYVAPESFSDVTWYTSIRPGTPNQINAGDFVSFMNPSPGRLTNQWDIEEGNFFLNNGFTRKDSVLDGFINYEAGLISKETTVHVLFTRPGINKVRLYTTFRDSVSFIGADTLHSEKVGDVWVIDKTFEVDVYDKIRPAFKVFNGDEEILSIIGEDLVQLSDSASWPEVTIEAGEALTYVDMTTLGRPDARTWSFEGGKPSASNDSTVTTAYFRMGNFYSSIRSRRSQLLPPGSEFKYVPLRIKVVRSNNPFVFDGNLMEHESGIISFNVTGETAPFLNEENNFTVHVSNDISGFDGYVDVASVQRNLNDATVIELTLAEPIYNTDVVTVSYSGGAIMSLDERPLEDFGPEAAALYYGKSVLNYDVFGFEIPADKNGGAYGWWGQNPQWFRSEEQAAEGFASMRFQIAEYESAANALTLLGAKAESEMLVPAGRYRMSLKVWVDPATTLTVLRTMLYPWRVILWDFSDEKRGEWVTLSQDLIFEEMDDMRIQINKADQPGGISGPQLLYVDEIHFIPLHERP